MCRFSLGCRRALRCPLRKRNTLRCLKELRRKLSCGLSGIFIFPECDVGCTTVKKDNVGATHLANNPATNLNSKRIAVRHHFLRERVANREFREVYVPSEQQHENFLTKPLHKEKCCVHRDIVISICLFCCGGGRITA